MISIIGLLYFLRAALFTVSKSVLDYIQPLGYIAIRMGIGGILILSYSLYKKSFTKKRFQHLMIVDGFDFFRLLISTLFHFITFFVALEYITTIDAALIANIAPFAAAYFSYYHFNEAMTLKKFIGLLLGFASLIPIYHKHGIWNWSMNSMHNWCFLLLMTLSALAGAYRWVIIRKLVKKKKYPITFIMSILMLSVSLFTICVLPFINAPLVTDGPRMIALLALAIFLGNILSDNLYAYLLKHYTATLLSFAGFTRPLFVAFLGFIFFGEEVEANFFYAMSMVIMGIYLFYQEELRQGYVES